MTVAARRIKKRAAKRPAARTVRVEITEGDYAGWEATARADFPARVLALLQSGSMEDIVKALDAIVIDHNMPDGDDEIAASMGEVDPYDGMMQIAGKIFDALGTLPNR